MPMAIELGRRLFRDPRLSPVGYISCVTCHQPDRAFTDKKARGHGLADLMRNTPTLVNLSLQTWYGWGGSSDSLWMASINCEACSERPVCEMSPLPGRTCKTARSNGRKKLLRTGHNPGLHF